MNPTKYIDAKVLIAILLFSFAFWGISYTADWESYSYAFEHQNFTRDAAFEWLSNFCNERGWGFVALYRFHIVLMGTLYAVLYKMLKLNPIKFVLLTLLLGYVGLGNQIRYYVAFPLTIIACLQLYSKKPQPFVCSILLQMVSMYFHSTTIILYLSFFFAHYFLRKYNSTKKIIIIAAANMLIYYIIYKSNWLVDEQYEAYKRQDKISSLQGGIFNLTPAFIAMYFVWKIKKVCLNTTNCICNSNCTFILTLITATLPLIFLSCYIQILGSRIIMALLPLYFGLFSQTRLYSNNHLCHAISQKAISITLLYFIIWRFCVPYMFGINAQQLAELTMMLESYKL